MAIWRRCCMDVMRCGVLQGRPGPRGLRGFPGPVGVGVKGEQGIPGPPGKPAFIRPEDGQFDPNMVPVPIRYCTIF